MVLVVVVVGVPAVVPRVVVYEVVVGVPEFVRTVVVAGVPGVVVYEVVVGVWIHGRVLSDTPLARGGGDEAVRRG